MIPQYHVCFNSVSPLEGQYEVNIYERVLGSQLTIYEIYKPHSVIPFSFVLDAKEADLKIFHDIVGTDDFDTDNYFIGMLWVYIHGTPFRRGDLDISLDDEPNMLRRNADDIIYNMEQTKIQNMILNSSFVGR